jgi:pilus assembly protein CpaB
MNFARLIVLGFAIATAGLAAYLVQSMSSSKGPANAALEPVVSMETSQVLVSTRDVTVGETVAAGDLRWQTWPTDALHASYIVKKAGTQNTSEWAGSVMRSPAFNGEPLTGFKMVRIGEGGVMANIIEPGMRAVSIKISAESGAGGFILPNDRVDVILTQKVKKGGSNGSAFESATLLHNLRVVAIDQTFHEGEGQSVVVGRTATLELSPRQSEELALGQALGSISLALRSLANADPSDLVVDTTHKKRTKVAVLRNARISGRQ